MENQQRLENEAIRLRNELSVKNKYYRGEGTIDNEHQYNEEHPDAISDGDPLGKGTGMSMSAAPQPGSTTNKGISYTNVDTTAGGGEYDIEGRNGVGGRNKSMVMNLYSKNQQYGPESVNTSKNVADGQYVV